MSFITTSFESLTGSPEWLAYIFVFVIGAVIGSFLNVIIHRIPNEESIVFPGSACPKCKTPLKAYDNIPILSWLILGGKCRNCKEKIAIRYPAVELLTALSWILVYWRFGLDPMLFVGFVFVSTIIASDVYRCGAHDLAERDHISVLRFRVSRSYHLPDRLWHSF
jgi:leader peptidase (prepilin peptidase)/N-methyltransferase